MGNRFDENRRFDRVRTTRQRAKLAKLEERIGHLMSQRALEEEKLAELIESDWRAAGYGPADPERAVRTCLGCGWPVDCDCRTQRCKFGDDCKAGGAKVGLAARPEAR